MQKGMFIGLICFACFFTNASEYRFESLSLDAQNESISLAINDRCDALAWGGPSFQDKFVRHRNGKITHIDASDGEMISPYAINNSGTVVGELWDSVSNRIIGFVQTKKGQFDSFASPHVRDAVHVRGINDRGDIVGFDDESGFIRRVDGSFDYIYYNGAPTLLSGINNKHEVSGQTADGLISFVRKTEGSFYQVKVPGAQQTLALSMNDRGAVVGFYLVDGFYHGFVRSPDGEFQTIDIPGGDATQVFGINNGGTIVVNAIMPSGHSAFIATPVRK
jgi:hypothetical protein